MTRKVVLQVCVGPAVREQLDDVAARLGFSRSRLARQVLEAVLVDERRFVALIGHFPFFANPPAVASPAEPDGQSSENSSGGIGR